MTSHHRLPISETEKQRRITSGLCLYCGEGGHIRKFCPSRPQQHPHGIGPQPPAHPPRHHHRYDRPPYDDRGRDYTFARPFPEPRPNPIAYRNPNLEPLGGRKRPVYQAPSHVQPLKYEDESEAVEIADLVRHRAEIFDQQPPQPTVEPRQRRKQQVKAQFLPGFSYPGGPLRLIHGTEPALTALEKAVTSQSLMLSQQSVSEGSKSFIPAFMSSIRILQAKGEFPSNFPSNSLDLVTKKKAKRGDELQLAGEPPFVSLNISNLLVVLDDASASLPIPSGSNEEITYQLGIVTATEDAGRKVLRVQLIAPLYPSANASKDNLRTIWLHRCISPSVSGGYEEIWRGFEKGAGVPSGQAARILRHPTTGDTLEPERDGSGEFRLSG